MSVFLVWQEWKRKIRFRLFRTIAICVMLLSLAAILLRPSLPFEKSRSILLLTPGFDKNKTDSLLKLYPALIIMRTANTKTYPGSTSLQSPYDLLVIGDAIRFISGHGLKHYALDLIGNKHFDFIPGTLPEGIIDLSLPRRIISNRRNTIEGVYNNVSGANWIYLSSPQGKEDSIFIKDKRQIPFNLSFLPRQSGNVLYEVTVKDSTGESIKENLPLTVDDARPLNILFIQSYPTFETQYLKNFLSLKKHRLVLRSQLSQNNFRYEYANRSPARINTVTKNAIAEFDVLIIDDDAYRKLSSAEKTIIKEEIESGLGMLNLLNTTPKNSKASDSFPFNVITVKTDTAQITQGSKRFILPALPLRVQSSTFLTPLTTNKSGILSGYTHKGAGKIGFQFLKETYRLSLSGDSVKYSEIWSPLIEQISRPRDKSSSIEIIGSFPRFRDEPMNAQIISSNEKTSLMADSIRIPLQEDVVIDDVWNATVWPDDEGWHDLQTEDSHLPYYISKNEEWETLAVANQMKETALVATTNKKLTNADKVTEQKEISSLPFYLLFILTAGFIWLAPKL